MYVHLLVPMIKNNRLEHFASDIYLDNISNAFNYC